MPKSLKSLLFDVADAPRKMRNLSRLVGPIGTTKFLLGRGLGAPARIRVRPKGCGRSLLIRTRGPDILVIRSVFGRGECDVELDPPPRVVVDGGGFGGYTAVYFAQKWPEARVIAVEPDPGNLAVLKENCRGLSGVEVVHGALWSSAMPLWIQNPRASTLEFKVAPARNASSTVEGIDIPTLLNRFGLDRIDLLKLDIEGAEAELFRTGAEAWINKVGCIVVELHSPECHEAMRHALKGLGHTETWQGEKVIVHISRESTVATGAQGGQPGLVGRR